MGLRELDAAMVFAPAVILPSQVASRLNRWPGERKLALAVLEEALSTIFRSISVVSKQGYRQRDDARRWVNTNDHEWPFSFLNVCDAVEIDAGSMRRAINEAVATGRRFNTRQWKRTTAGLDGGGGLNSDSPEVRRKIALLGVRARRVSQRQVRAR